MNGGSFKGMSKEEVAASDKAENAHLGRQKATVIMRHRAEQLQRQAAGWLALANALDNIEKHAHATAGDGESGPHIGAGSDAEQFLWALAAGHVK